MLAQGYVVFILRVAMRGDKVNRHAIFLLQILGCYGGWYTVSLSHHNSSPLWVCLPRHEAEPVHHNLPSTPSVTVATCCDIATRPSDD